MSRFVSIGSRCQTAYQLRRFFGDEESQFFDWLFVRPASVRRLIENDFDSFINENQLTPQIRISPTLRPYRLIYQQRYDVEILHDMPTDDTFVSTIEQARQKYEFLADRWRTLMRSGEPVVFVSFEFPVSAVDELYMAIQAAYSDLEFWCLAVCPDQTTTRSANPKVLVKSILKQLDPDDWQGDDSEWDRILNEALCSIGGDNASPRARSVEK
jgi:hypothetical protein